jgi:hypothetical protein
VTWYNKTEPTEASPEMHARMDAFAERWKDAASTVITAPPTETVMEIGLPEPIEDLPSDSIEPEVVYVAGPMRGRPENGFPAFDRASAFLRDKGYFVTSPAEMDREHGWFAADDKNRSTRTAVATEAKEVCWAQKIALLPGWEDSFGAKSEVAIALSIALSTPTMSFIDATTGLPISKVHVLDGMARGYAKAADAERVRICDEVIQDETPDNGEIPPDLLPIDPNPKDVIGSGKVPLGIVSDIACAEEALALTEGGSKYGAYNYRAAPVRASIYLDAARRHIAKWQNGESRDYRTGVHHLGSVRACIGIILDADAMGTLIDDRPPANPAVIAMIDAMDVRVKHIREMFKDRNPKHYSISDEV